MIHFSIYLNTTQATVLSLAVILGLTLQHSQPANAQGTNQSSIEIIDPTGYWLRGPGNNKSDWETSEGYAYHIQKTDAGIDWVNEETGWIDAYAKVGGKPNTYRYLHHRYPEGIKVRPYAKNWTVTFKSEDAATFSLREGVGGTMRRDPTKPRRKLAKWFLTDQPSQVSPPKVQTISYGDSATGSGINTQWSDTGYHIFKMDPFNPQHTGKNGNTKIFDQYPQDGKKYTPHGGYNIPSYYIYDKFTGSASSFNTRVFSSEQSRLRELSKNVSVEGSVGGFGLSVGAKLAKDTKTVVNTRIGTGQTAVLGEKIKHLHWLTLNKRTVKLDVNFRNKISRLAAEVRGDGYDQIKKFYDSFGTHYPLSVLYGGKAYYQENVSTSRLAKEYSTSLNQQTNLEASGGALGLALKAGYGSGSGASNGTESITQSQLDKKKVITLDGSGTTFQSFDVPDANRALPLRLELRPLHELIEPYFPKMDKTKRTHLVDEMRKALDRMKQEIPPFPETQPMIQKIKFEVQYLRVTKVSRYGNPQITGSLSYAIGLAPEIGQIGGWWGDSKEYYAWQGPKRENNRPMYITTSGVGWQANVQVAKSTVLLPSTSPTNTTDDSAPHDLSVWRYPENDLPPKVYFRFVSRIDGRFGTSTKGVRFVAPEHIPLPELRDDVIEFPADQMFRNDNHATFDMTLQNESGDEIVVRCKVSREPGINSESVLPKYPYLGVMAAQ